MTIYEQILAGLQTKFTGADTATLQRISTKKAEGITDEAQVQAIVDAVTFMDVMTNYGDFRADGASKTSKKNAIADYEKQYGIKDGKPLEKKEEKPLEQTEVKPLTAEQIQAMVTAGVAAAMKPFGERLDQMDADTKRKAFDAKIEDVARTFDIPKYAYKGRTIAEDTDLNRYFTDLKQEMVNEGFKFAKAPESGKQTEERNSEDIAALIKGESEKK